MANCRSCYAEIIWLDTEKGNKMPVNPEVVKIIVASNGNTTIVTSLGKIIKGFRIDTDQVLLFEEVTALGYVSHFATCPNALQHRRK